MLDLVGQELSVRFWLSFGVFRIRGVVCQCVECALCRRPTVFFYVSDCLRPTVFHCTCTGLHFSLYTAADQLIQGVLALCRFEWNLTSYAVTKLAQCGVLKLERDSSHEPAC
jgi:hypothetical protein